MRKMRLQSIIRDINDNGEINSQHPRRALLCNKMTAQDDCSATIPLHRNLKRGKYNATEKAEEFNNPDAIFTRSRIFPFCKEAELHLMWSWMKGVEDEEAYRVSVILFTCRISTIPDARDAAGESESRGVLESAALSERFDLLGRRKKTWDVALLDLAREAT